MDQRATQRVDGMSSSNNIQQQHQQQQQQQQHMQHQQHRVQQQIGGQGVMPVGLQEVGGSVGQGMTQQHRGAAAAMATPLMMNLMTNPAFAAAAAASPLFPPAAMLSNPGAFLAMPEAFAMSAANMNAASQQQSAALGGTNAPGHVSNQTGLVTLPPGVAMPPTASLMSRENDNNLSSCVGTHQSGSNISQASAAQHHGQSHIVPSMKPPTLSPYNLSMNASPQSAGHSSAASGMMAGFQAPPPGSSAASAGGLGSSDKDRKGRSTRAELTPEEKAKQNRDRNKEHARSTRLRKKAYVQKLKELVECLHAERTEEVRQRRVAIQHLAEKQNVRRNVVRNFLRFHASHETDTRKWTTILEDEFWLKQPVTPYRSFRRAEIQQECRVSKRIEAVESDAASLCVMIEGIGSRSQRWMQIKREEFALLESSHRGKNQKIPQCIQKQDSRLQHTISSLSSSSASSNQFSSSGEDSRGGTHAATRTMAKQSESNGQGKAAKVSSSSGSSNESRKNQNSSSKEFHDYHSMQMPDGELNDSEHDESRGESSGSSNVSSNGETKRVSTDSSSGDDSTTGAVADGRTAKRRKINEGPSPEAMDGSSEGRAVAFPSNIAKKGGIGHCIRPEQMPPGENTNARLNMAPAVALPPFAGIGNKRSAQRIAHSSVARAGEATNNLSASNNMRHQPAVISADIGEGSSSSSGDSKIPEIRAQYHINEDDMILMDDILMCPFVFRSHNAVLCGALSECVMPGMLRAHFSPRNKLQSLELVYDAMGFMQQLERASGNEGTAQIIPGSLEMALTPSTADALVITLAKPPFLIVNVNEVWTRTTGYTQMEVEGREYLALLEGDGTVAAAAERSGKPRHKLEDVARGKCACSTNIHYDKEGRDFIEFVCSYPLTNAADEVTHLLHVSKELPSPQEASSSMGLDSSS
ncbi:hypothetical protein ACA910_000755 [Epithemia clementina (nom. ined.)]